MRVRFACNVMLPPVYPPACHLSTPDHTQHPAQPSGRVAHNRTLESHPGHRLTQRRLSEGLAPSMSVTRASGRLPREGTLHPSPIRRGRSLRLGVPTCGPPRADDTRLLSGSGDHVQPGPPVDDPSGDMDCSEDLEGVQMVPSEKARASMPPTMDVVAPQEHPALSECAVSHGLGRHGCTDGNSEASSPCRTTPILLPEEWLAAYQTISDITSQSLEQTSTHPPILPGCASFASCIDLSRAYAVKVDIDAIESTATTLLAAGKGIDHDVMSDHMDRIQQMGMSAALLSFSGQTLPTTLHPRPHLVINPPPRHPPLPVRPHASLVTHLSEEQERSLMAHQARLPTPPPVDPLPNLK